MDGDAGETDAYLKVRALLLARKWSGADTPRSEWFKALAEAGFLNVMGNGPLSGGSLMGGGLARVLTVAEIFGGYMLPLSFVPAAAVVGGLASARSSLVDLLLEGMLSGGPCVLPALQRGEKTLRVDAGGGLNAAAAPDGGLIVNGDRFAVPDTQVAAAFVAEAQVGDDIVLFLVEAGAAGLSVEHLPAASGDHLGALKFKAVKISADHIVARGSEAAALLDVIRFTVQLGLGAELAGLGAALLTRAGAAISEDHRLAGPLMDVMLARAFVFGVAGMAEPCRPGALEMIAGARAATSEAALSAARLALSVVSDDDQRAGVEKLARRALVLSRIYRQPEAHRLRFAQWRLEAGYDRGIFAELSAAAGAPGKSAPSAQILPLLDTWDRVRSAAQESGVLEDPIFSNNFGKAETKLMGLVCADAQRQAGGDIASSFLAAAVVQTSQELADCSLQAMGTHAAIVDGADWAANFVAAYRAKSS